MKSFLKKCGTGISFLVFIFSFGLEVSAEERNIGASIASGRGDCQITPIRIGLQKAFERQWRTESNYPMGGYWEGSLYYMKGRAGKQPGSHNSLYAGAIAGVLRFEKKERGSLGWPYFDLGIGLSLLSQKEIGGKEMGMNFQFEDRAGIGIRFGENREYDLGYRFVHFSNAHLAKRNAGLNLHLIVFSYWF